MDPILAIVQLLGFVLNMFFTGMFTFGYLQGTCKGWVAAVWSSMFVIFSCYFLWGLHLNLTQTG